MSLAVTGLSTADRRESGRRARNRRRLVDAATTLFLRLGPDDTTIAAICERAGVVERTFFNHFRTKDELIDVIINERIEAVAIVIDGSAPGADGVAGLLESLAEEIETLAASAGPGYRRFLAHIIHVRGSSATLRGGRLHDAFLHYVRRCGPTEAGSADEMVLADLAAGSIMIAIANWTRDPSFRLRDNIGAYAAYLTQ